MRGFVFLRVAPVPTLLTVALLAGCDQALDPPSPAVKAEAALPVAETPEPQVVDDDPPALAALRKDMPPDVSDFIRRAVICNHWAGEEPYDEDRRAQIAAAVGTLRCRELDADQALLRDRYAADPDVLRRLSLSRKTPL